MSLAGVINSHTMAALIVLGSGTDDQRQRFLPRFATGEARGGLCLTEPHAGTDVQAIRTTARRRGDTYVVHGTKMFITNGREGNTFALLAVTDPAATPRHRGMSCFIVEKGAPGFHVVKSLRKLGYKGVDTVELVFEDMVVPAANLVGGIEGRGFKHVMAGLETGRINIAARAVGVAQGALEACIDRARAQHAAHPAVADVATRVHAARLLTAWAAAMKDRGERCDLEAGMAKLYASESAQAVAVRALVLHGADGRLERLPVERHYRDTPLMIIGEGTNEIQRVIIARSLLERYGERPGAVTSREHDPDERRAMVMAVRQFVEKEIVPVAGELDGGGHYPAALVHSLAGLGIFGALVPPEYGGLGLDLHTLVTIIEELARGWSTVAAIVASHVAATHAIARFGTSLQRERLLPPMTRGETIAVTADSAEVESTPTAGGVRVRATARAVEHATRASLVLIASVAASSEAFAVPASRTLIAEPEWMLGGRGLAPANVSIDTVLGTDARLPPAAAGAATRVLRLASAATAVGVAQAAFEAALRYAQQRTTFGVPIAQHQAIQLKLADMATGIAASRLLTRDAAEHDDDDARIAMARIDATETAYAATLDALRIHGGYGYVAEFPVERFYRDAGRLLVTPWPNDVERHRLARHLTGAPGTRCDNSSESRG
jgi:alkylation response protein AidB-like acyl-CoA dehydrogenase